MRYPKAFTDRFLAALKPAAKAYDVTDPTRKGLIVRLTPAGTKTFYFRYRRAGAGARLLIGHYPTVSLQQAYEAHAEFTRRLHRGEDPLASPALATPRASDEPTVGDLADEFLRRYVYLERKRPEEAEQAIRANVLKRWKNRPAKSITRRDAILLLDRIVDRGSPVMANRIAALLSQMFRFGVERGLIEASPLVALPRPGGREKPRERTLTETEIRTLWRKLGRAHMSRAVQNALKLVLVTGQRPGEVAQALCCEFDLKNALWTIPVERSKNGKAHAVPLSPLARAVLRHIERETAGVADRPADNTEPPEALLPSPWRVERDGAPLTVRSLSQSLRKNLGHIGLAAFTPHDLRRTAASGMTACGVPRLHVEKVLNHTTGDVAEIYDRHDYAAEKRAALERWGERLLGILRARRAKVVPLRSPEPNRREAARSAA